MKHSKLNTILSFAFLLGMSQAFAAPNPASVYCAQLGGELDLVDTEQGQISLCTFGEAAIDEWTFYRFKNLELPQTAVSQFCLSHKRAAVVIPYQETAYCNSLGGELVQGTRALNGSPVRLCRFSTDSSMIEEKTLFLGAHASSTQELNRYLGCN
jgi:putative hemolysin